MDKPRFPVSVSAASAALVLAAAGALGAPATPAAAEATAPRGCTESEGTITCNSPSSGPVSLPVPAGQNLVTITAQGAAGGDGSGGIDPGRGGFGGTATATFPVRPGQTLRFFLGGEGAGSKRPEATVDPAQAGPSSPLADLPLLSALGPGEPVRPQPAPTLGGGGAGGGTTSNKAGTGGAGGGATVVYLGNGSPTSGAKPLLVAGGGGGGGGVSPHGARVLGEVGNGGGPGGGAGAPGGGDGGGKGGTATAGGPGGRSPQENAGQDGRRTDGGKGADPRTDSTEFAGGGGGGGGFFGGGGGASGYQTRSEHGLDFAALGGGGGGGSSFISAAALTTSPGRAGFAKPHFDVAGGAGPGMVTVRFGHAGKNRPGAEPAVAPAHEPLLAVERRD